MKTEFQFLMAPEDEAKFESFVSVVPEMRIRPGNAYDELVIGEAAIQFIRSKSSASTLTSGRIALMTKGDAPEIEKAFNKLRTWLKRSYSNDLAAINIRRPEVLAPVKYMWLGPSAARLLMGGSVTLKDFAAENVAYVQLAPNPSLGLPLSTSD